jgi:hypothetical protein
MNYASEISRVLKEGRKALITLFLINGQSMDLIRSGSSTRNFTHRIQECLVIKEKDPEYAVAHDEEYVTGLFGQYGLEIVRPIHYGSWCGRDNFVSYQDIVIVTKGHSS